MKKLALTLVFLSYASIGAAATLQGKVIDGVTSEPLFRVEVVVFQHGHSVGEPIKTDGAGMYEVKNLDTGSVIAQHDKNDYSEPQQKEVAELTPGVTLLTVRMFKTDGDTNYYRDFAKLIDQEKDSKLRGKLLRTVKTLSEDKQDLVLPHLSGSVLQEFNKLKEGAA